MLVETNGVEYHPAALTDNQTGTDHIVRDKPVMPVSFGDVIKEVLEVLATFLTTTIAGLV